MIKLAVSGAAGRMGQRITDLAFNDSDLQVTTLLEREGDPKVGFEVNGVAVTTDNENIQHADALIEFTSPEATIKHLECCLEYNVKMVIGTTGFTKNQIQQIQKAADQIPIVFASNMSVGVNILFGLARYAAERLPKNYKIKIIEAHHVHKKDAPSGTAKTIAEIIEQASGREVTDIDSIREGEIIGDHQIILEGPDDTITLNHSAGNRDIFAKGSLVAAKFLMNKDKGLYTMEEVLRKE